MQGNELVQQLRLTAGVSFKNTRKRHKLSSKQRFELQSTELQKLLNNNESDVSKSWNHFVRSFPIFQQPKGHWGVYILASSNSDFVYTGYTQQLLIRVLQHNGLLSGGASQTRKNGLWIPVQFTRHDTLSEVKVESDRLIAEKRKKTKEQQDLIVSSNIGIALSNLMSVIRVNSGDIWE
jgi:predicted GIY-YIG superfamily endonuclease